MYLYDNCRCFRWDSLVQKSIRTCYHRQRHWKNVKLKNSYALVIDILSPHETSFIEIKWLVLPLSLFQLNSSFFWYSYNYPKREVGWCRSKTNDYLPLVTVVTLIPSDYNSLRWWWKNSVHSFSFFYFFFFCMGFSYLNKIFLYS